MPSPSPEYTKHYRETHKDFIKANRRKYYLKNLVRFRKEGKQKYQEQRKEALKLIGDKCIICGYSGKKLTFHEIHGEKHHRGMKYYLDHPKDFVPLCYPHHKFFHLLAGLTEKDRKIYKSLLYSLTKDELEIRIKMGDCWYERRNTNDGCREGYFGQENR